MSFDHGSFTVTIFELPEALPDNYLELFAAHRAGTLDSVTDEMQVGWVSGKHLLETRIEESTTVYGGGCFLTLRKAVRKIPTALLNAMCKREEDIWMRANEAEFVSKKVKREIKEDILENNLQKFPPAVSGIPLVIDLASNLVYLGTASTSQIDEVIGMFQQSCQVEPIQIAPPEILTREFNKTCTDLPGLELANVPFNEPNAGRDFLTFLWYYNEIGGMLEHPEYGSFQVALDGPLTFSGDNPECNGAAETTVKKGENPLRSAEAKAALQVGKKLKKCRLSIVHEEQVWSCTFDADRFAFGSLKLPEGEKLDADSVLQERLFSMRIFTAAIYELFKLYAGIMLGADKEKELAKMRNWMAEREGV